MNDFYEDEIVSALINKFPLIKKDTLQIQCIFSQPTPTQVVGACLPASLVD